MSPLYLIAALALAAACGLGLVLWQARRRKNARLERRLLRGRSHLLEEEVQSRLQALDALHARTPQADEEAAEAVLDEIQVLLVERQAHLQTYADLAHLQKTKIDLLARQRRLALDQVPDEPTAPRPPSANQPLTPPDRDELENAIKARIEALKPPKKKPKR